LDEVELRKPEIRVLARRAGLPVWDEPASACLSSRIPYHQEVTDEKLRMIERAEGVLRDLGFQICRVRHHDTLARIELGRDEIARAFEPELSEAIDRQFRAIGYQHVTVDLRGYRLGSLNEALRLRPV
ncbi:MAG: ATP-dependent sacrificial sulfur transferase LarE, partial [Vicinamibacterales bacterium]